jgi:aryl-alcohol dehydrogenase-like predicted oxidoreductase
METRKLGSEGPLSSAIGLGCMGMSDLYGPADQAESIATIHAALDAGINLLDSGDFYGMGDNEMLLRKALEGRKRDGVLISIKFGAMRDPARGWLGVDNRPAAVKNFLTYSLRRLGTDYIDIYRPARLDAAVPIEDTVGAIADMVKAGYVRHIALSEVGADTVRRAAAVHPIVDLQIEYSLMSRGPEATIFPTLTELGIATTAYGVLSRGLLAGSKPTGAKDFRAHLPRFTGANAEKNQQLVEALARLAADRGVKPAQLAIAWVRAKGSSIVPTIGARKREQLADALGALDIALSVDEVTTLEAAVPASAVAGTRYAEPLMKHLDSER